MRKTFVTRMATAFALIAVLSLAILDATASSLDVTLTREEENAIASVSVLSRAFAGVAKIIRPAVVNIKVERRVTVTRYNNPFEFFGGHFPGAPRIPRGQNQVVQTSGGSGVIIDAKGYILTNNHVVGDADSIRVSLLDGREFPAELIGTDPSSDVAVIKIQADFLNTATIADSDAIEVGEWVLAVGNPFGLDFTVTTGIVSARGRSGFDLMEIEDFIQTDASINPGNSGGPLVNLRGEVIGINTFIYSPTQSGTSTGVGFAIPSNIAKNIMQSLIAHKQVTASYLGVETQVLTQELAQAFGLKAPRGALIKSVNKDSPGEKAGLRRGDVVVRWGKREITDDQQLRNLVTITTPGEPVDIEVIREGRTVLLRVVLEAQTPEMVIEGRSDRFLQNLGITVTDITPEVLSELGYEPDATGVLVTTVDRGSPADNLGIVPGSILLNINGKDIRNQQELKNLIGSVSRVENYDLVWRTGRFLQRARLRGN